MTLDLSTLNPEQKSAVQTLSGSLMILAGAGTGKTRVITFRIANLILYGTSPRKIAAMTFTNKAANEMKERLRHIIPKETCEKVFMGTFHRFCLTILRQWHECIERPANFTLLGTSDQLYLIKQALEEAHLDGLNQAEDVLYEISKCKNALITPSKVVSEEAAKILKIKDLDGLRLVYENYERLLKVNKALDFDDCILKTYFLLKNYENVKEKIRVTYTHFLVDEFQDTNHSQFSLLQELVGPKGNICVVGDDDQSIYSWRGAVYETFMNFEKFFEHTRIVKLEQNYRCPNVVLAAANALIRNNTLRNDKSLWSKNPHHNEIVFKTLKSHADEARWIAERCLGFLGRGYKLSDIAILYRTNSQSKSLEMGLRECGLFYKTYGGQSFFSKKETKDFISYLELIANFDNHIAFWRIVNTPPRGVGIKAKESIFEEAENLGISPFRFLQKNQDPFAAKLQTELDRFVDNIETFHNKIPIGVDNLEEFFSSIIGSFSLVSHTARTTKDDDAREKKMETYKDLPGLFAAIARQAFKDKTFSLRDFLELVTLDPSGYDAKEETTNHISLMTIHAAKGLEFPIVFLAGCEEGLLPHKNSLLSNKGLEEERRLLYVAITRAKEHLLLSASQGRKKGNYIESNPVSRFIKELPLSFEEKKIQAEEKEEIKKKTLGRLKSLRESLLEDNT